jgi:hypothetical protein
VEGFVEQRGDLYVVRAEEVRVAEEPSDPYLY